MARLSRNEGRWSSRREAVVRSDSSVLPWDPTKALLCPASSCNSSRFLEGLVLTLCAFVLLVVPVFGQTDVNDVHVVPREVAPPKQAPKQDLVTSNSGLSAHVRPLKVDVDLVLVPVTITDPMNRLVTGLDKENFQLFEGSTAQEIKTFSSEDAPVSWASFSIPAEA